MVPKYVPVDLEIYALYAPNRYLAAKTRVFIDFLVQRFGKKADWSGLAKSHLVPAVRRSPPRLTLLSLRF